MPNGSRLPGFLRQPVPRAVTIALVLQIAVYHALPATEIEPLVRPLNAFPTAIGPWQMVQEGLIEKEILDVLKADDTLNRHYVGPGSRAVNLFVAFFKTQRTGVAPHSPKVCLPGSGWVPTESSIISIPVPGRSDPIPLNRTTIARGNDNRSVVLYWYQSRDRVVADEYRAKLYSMYDSIRYRRSDTSLMRVVVPVVGGDENAARIIATKFVQDAFPLLRSHLPD